ncbi:pyridoxamine 5'-phosphate oxidase [Tamaricihabitans halophyticus]|uniref:Pyridoxamine 5'-phosphate oxidase n=1 Tax=Tamaricihabitans halophyticus TaxID=1262583 RepID=A0A4R2Q490_9PSEU|nr:pyridoxamine 5'-phosphate oxidase family protein [Tamaricihabitans halophyticus]TCP43410.1 pyridoxamine 5'-phosphate oxidase [Tamaricihabitans halophyticus]
MTDPIAELLFSPADTTPMSTDEATIKPWSQAVACLAAAPKVWLCSVRGDGRPHVMPVLVAWVDDSPCVATRPGSRKAVNLAENSSAVLTVSGDELDLVVEGVAELVTRAANLDRIAAALLEKYEWEFAVRDGAVYDVGPLGPVEYLFYRIRPNRAFGYGSDGLTATRWRFGPR